MFENEAEEYYYKTYPVTLNIGEEERKNEVTDIFIKGAELGYDKVNDQLTKAKELLKRCYDNYIYLEPLRSEIAQFLSEVEK